MHSCKDNTLNHKDAVSVETSLSKIELVFRAIQRMKANYWNSTQRY